MSGRSGTAVRTGSEEQLRRISAVTDSALADLDVEHLLIELLDRARDVLGVDAATVLLLDHHAQELVATATRGLEDEVRQGVRLPLGRGFAGRVARERRPVSIRNLTRKDVVSPALIDRGIRSVLGVPMIAGGEIVGVLHVGTYTPRRFTDEDTNLLQIVADRAGLATQSRQAGVDRAAARAVQRSLLPTRLPEVPGVEMAARYVAGHEAGMGGDWYDVFVLPTGSLGIVIGDVTGHGLRAAVVMGRLRSALRAYALETEEPGEVLNRLDRKVQHFEAGMMATAAYAIIPPQRDRARISLAGHLPPVLAEAGRVTRFLEMPVDLPLGAGDFRQRRSTVVDLSPGSVVVLYTDGLVERRGEPIDKGLRRLADVITSAPANEVCATVMATLVGSIDPVDDIALFAMRRKESAPA
jgi:putative methionine-R-sulfoxide reductase with GAF domain